MKNDAMTSITSPVTYEDRTTDRANFISTSTNAPVMLSLEIPTSTSDIINK